jgi:hypothetical protein
MPRTEYTEQKKLDRAFHGVTIKLFTLMPPGGLR